MGLAGIRGDLLRAPSETAVNETSESASFPLADLTPFLGGASDECLAQSAAFAEGLARRENWALQSEFTFCTRLLFELLNCTQVHRYIQLHKLFMIR